MKTFIVFFESAWPKEKSGKYHTAFLDIFLVPVLWRICEVYKRGKNGYKHGQLRKICDVKIFRRRFHEYTNFTLRQAHSNKVWVIKSVWKRMTVGNRIFYQVKTIFCNKVLAYKWIHEFHVTSSPQQQSVGNKISLKTDDGWESDLLPSKDNIL